ncbi:hypothetical protein HU200_053430 [Digitaria exilis]|uniref:Lipoprotein n=1 Tax=Digitaria exilis TaxID=1010633 RepID=A0A835AHG1_9POAL|nr:hypothetical protein HU200_053430 [Digitaria exilis]
MACAAMVILFSFLLLGCDGASDPPSSSTVKHEKIAEVHVRKLLNLGKQLIEPAAVPAVTPVGDRKTAASPVECSEEFVAVCQAEASRWLGGMPSYSVTITNTDVHVSCGEFGSAKLVDPTSFRLVTAGDCLVSGGGAMQPGESVSFDYSNMYPYHLDVTSVSCTWRP